MAKIGSIEAPVAESFHEFGKLFAPGLIPLAVPSELRWPDTELLRNE
jgi:hypothetical protein